MGAARNCLERCLEGDWTNHLSITLYYRLHQEKAFSAIFALLLMKALYFSCC